MKKSGFALASAIIGTFLFVFVALQYYGSYAGYNDIISNSVSISVYALAAAISLNWAGWLKNASTPMMICGILYCMAGILAFAWLLFMALPIIFSFVAYARIRRTE